MIPDSSLPSAPYLRIRKTPSIAKVFCGSLLAVTLAAIPSTNALAGTLLAESYYYNAGGLPSWSYPDTTPPTKLTDGVTGDAANWYNGDFVLWNTDNGAPSITFDFSEKSSLESFSIFCLANGDAGIAPPPSITLTDVATSQSYTFILDPNSFGAADAHWVSFDLPEPLQTNELILTALLPEGGWLGVSEVSFQSIPEPSSLSLIGAVIFGGLLRTSCRSRIMIWNHKDSQSC